MLEVKKLTKTFGTLAAVRSVSFSVSRGEVVGFLGPNGAGKTTTFRMIAGSLGPSSGKVAIDGLDLSDAPRRAKAAIGYMPESVPLYPEMTVREHLTFKAELRGLDRKTRASELDRVAEATSVAERYNTRIAHLSKGFRKRVGLADALLGNPPLLLLDEPTAGLDPNQVQHFRALVRQLAADHAILLSTHVLSEIEASCGRAIVINQGVVAAEGSLDELRRARSTGRVSIRVRSEAQHLTSLLSAETRSAVHESDGFCSFSVPQDAASSLVAKLVRADLPVVEVAPLRAALDDVFQQLTEAADALEDH